MEKHRSLLFFSFMYTDVKTFASRKKLLRPVSAIRFFFLSMFVHPRSLSHSSRPYKFTLSHSHSFDLSLSLSLSSRNVQQVINIKDKKNKMTNNKCIVAVDSSNSYLTKLVGVKERRDDVGYREIVIRSTSGRRASFPFSSLSVTYPRYSPTIESGKNGSRTILLWFDSTRLDSIQFDSIRLG